MQFICNGTTYNAGKLDAFTQLHIVRRLTPCIGKLAALVGAESDAQVNAGNLDAILTPLTQAVAALSDADTEYIINACLDVTERRQQGGGFAGVRVNGVTMYTLSLPEMLQVTYNVIKANLEDFIAALPSGFDAQGLMSHVSGSVFQMGKTSS